MEYDHGRRVTPEVWELSPLDLSIYEYERKCKDFYCRKAKPENETEAQRKSRLGELKTAKSQLDREFSRLMALVSVEEQLENYRNEFSDLKTPQKLRAMDKEAHHPTDTLETNLRLAGRAQPSPRYSAHHIVEGKGKLADTKRVRLHLAKYNIRINDPDNGVWMPMTDDDRGHWAMPKCPPHSRIHTKKYEEWVRDEVIGQPSEQHIRNKLIFIRNELKYGRQPLSVTTDAYNKKFGLAP